MAELILKAAPDDDMFVIWSTIVDAPVWAGDRTDLLEQLIRSGPLPGDPPAVRIARAEKTGTSAKDGSYAWGHDLMYEARGFLPRNRLGELARRLEANNSKDDDLLIPLDA